MIQMALKAGHEELPAVVEFFYKIWWDEDELGNERVR